MEEYTSNKLCHVEYVDCPKCGRTLKLDLDMAVVNGELVVWYEGLCIECLDVIVDPMPILTEMTEENRRMLWRILSN